MRKRTTRKIAWMIILFMNLIIALVIIAAFIKRSENRDNYSKAKEYISIQKYKEAFEILMELDTYKDSDKLAKRAKKGIIYSNAKTDIENKKYEEAIKKLNEIGNFLDTANLIKDTKYNLALDYLEQERYDEAKRIFSELENYKETTSFLKRIDLINIAKLKKEIYKKACLLFDESNYEEALENFNSILDYEDSKERAKECENQIKIRNLNNTISGGIRHSAAILDGGTSVAVGDEDDNRCNVIKFENMVSIDAGGCFTIGLQKNGKVKVAGTFDDGLKIDTNSRKWEEEKFIDIAAGERFVVGLTENGSVIGDGHKDDGQIYFKSWKKEKFIAIDTGWRFTVGLTKNKELKFSGIYGDQYKDFNENKTEWKDVVNISAAGGDTTGKKRGSGHTVGLKSDGTVVAVGDNSWGQCNVYGKKWKNIIKVAAGDWYTVGLKKNGQVLITGKNRDRTKYIEEDVLEEINSKKDIVDVAAGYGQTLFLHKNGTITAFGFNEEGKYSKTLKWVNVMTPLF